MSSEPGRRGQLQKRQLADLQRYLADEVHPFVAVHRRALDAAGVDRGRVAGLDEFARLPTVTIDDLGTGADHLVEPSPDAARAHGPLGDRILARFAAITGRGAQYARDEIEPRYRPVLWTRDRRLRTGWSADDLARLGDLGRRTLERAGVRRDDRLLSVGLDADRVGHWQIALGARAGGVSALHISDPERGLLREGGVTVVAGTTAAVEDIFAGVEGHEVRLVIVVGPPLHPDERAELTRRCGAEVVQVWAPTGVRALWGERRGVPGLVTAPDCDVIEILDTDDRPVADGTDGEVVWSSLGWAGTVVLRLRTGVIASQRAEASGTGGVAIILRDPGLVVS